MRSTFIDLGVSLRSIWRVLGGDDTNSEGSLSPSVFFLTRLLDTLDNAASVWKDVKSQAPITQQNLIPLTKLWSQKTEEEIETYQSVVTNQVRFVMQYVM